jgi:hypothetical protein
MAPSEVPLSPSSTDSLPSRLPPLLPTQSARHNLLAMRFFGIYEDPLRTARLFERVFARPLGAVPVDTSVNTAGARRLQVRSLAMNLPVAAKRSPLSRWFQA